MISRAALGAVAPAATSWLTAVCSLRAISSQRLKRRGEKASTRASKRNRSRSLGLRLAAGDVGGDGDHVLQLEAGDDLLHRRDLARALAVLDVVKLAHDVGRRASADVRNVAAAVQVRVVAAHAWLRPASDERPALLQAALRHISGERRARIAILRTLEILRHFDDALADRFAAAVGRFSQHATGDEGLRHAIGLDDLD